MVVRENKMVLPIDQELITNFSSDPKKKPIVYEVTEIPTTIPKGSTITFGKVDSTELNHGIYSYPAKFIPQIARWAINYTNTKKGQTLLDPFCGSGTSLVEARIRGINNYGVDKNPLARLLSKVKTTPLFPGKKHLLYEASDKLIEIIKNSDDTIDLEDQDDVNLHYNWKFWFEESKMKELIKIKRCIGQFQFKNYENNEQDLIDFFRITLAATIKKVSFLDENQIKVKLDKKKVQNGLPQPLAVFSQLTKKHLRFMIEFTQSAERYPNTLSKIIGDDARKISLKKESIDLVVTSPPYINAIDYPFAHKQELFILDLVKPDDYRPHSREYIGVSERVLLKEMYKEIHLTKFEPVDNLIKLVYSGGKDVDANRAFVIYQYFTGMEKVLKEMMRIVRPNGNFVMFVGSNTIRNNYVPTHELLQQMAEEKIGFSTDTYFYHKMKRRKLGIPRNVTGGTIPTEMAIAFSKE